MEHEFLFGIFRPEKQDCLPPSDVPLLTEIFLCNDQKDFQPDFPESFCKQLEFSSFLVHS